MCVSGTFNTGGSLLVMEFFFRCGGGLGNGGERDIEGGKGKE